MADRLPEAVKLDGQEVAAIEHALAVYDAAPRGTTPRQINKMLTKLALAYPNLKLSDQEAEARMELYAEMLADIDVDVLGAGFRAAVQRSKFFPSVSELREFAMQQPATPRQIRRNRLAILLMRHREQPETPAEPYATPEQVAAIKAEMGIDSPLLDRIVGTKAA